MDPRANHIFTELELYKIIKIIRQKELEVDTQIGEAHPKNPLDARRAPPIIWQESEGNLTLSSTAPEAFKLFFNELSKRNGCKPAILTKEINSLLKKGRFTAVENKKMLEITFSLGRFGRLKLKEIDSTPKLSTGGFFGRHRTMLKNENAYIRLAEDIEKFLKIPDLQEKNNFLKTLKNVLSQSEIKAVKNTRGLRERADYGLFKFYSDLPRAKSPIPNRKKTKKVHHETTHKKKKKLTPEYQEKKCSRFILVNELNNADTVSDSNVVAPLKRKATNQGMSQNTPAKHTQSTIVNQFTRNIVAANIEYKANPDEQKTDYQIPQEIIASLQESPDDVFERLHLVGRQFIGEIGNEKPNIVVGRHSCNSQMYFLENKIAKIRQKYDVMLTVTATLVKIPNSKKYYNLAKSIEYEIKIGKEFHFPENRKFAPSITFTFDPLSTKQLKPIKQVATVINTIMDAFISAAVTPQNTLDHPPTPPSLI